jgi:DMSO/TMAO reductase YedYZ heme-binding membrane subunit
MSVGFRAIQWNRDKLVYDGLLLAALSLYVTVFLNVVPRFEPPKDALGEIDLRIRAFGSAAFVMLTVILSIGPLTRLDQRFLPLLYNRRHFGVLTFCVALAHVWFMIDWYLAQHTLPSLGTELIAWRITASSSAFRSKRSALRRCLFCSCWRRQAMTSG